MILPLALFCAFSLCLPLLCLATDTLKVGFPLLDRKDNGDNLVSIGQQQFELGFFSPNGSSNRFLGIWYHRIQLRTVVWVANRDNPIPPSETGVFQIKRDGNLTLGNVEGRSYWSYTPQQVSSLANLTLKLMDSGNLILRDNLLQVTYWQSFEHPTDTFLPGMKMDTNLVLTSWRGPSDPGSGNYTFARGKTGHSLYTIYKNRNQVYWAGETPQDFASEGAILNLLANLNQTNITYQSKSMPGTTLQLSDFESERLVMNPTGHVELLGWEKITRQWTSSWREPENDCKIYNRCGNYSSCNIKSSPSCRCLPGFTPVENPIASSNYRGCFRESSCGQNMTTFIDLKKVKVRKPDNKVDAANETECRSLCFNGTGCPNCTAYSYDASSVFSKTYFPCSIWTFDLPTLQEDIDPGINLAVLVNTPDIERTPRTCRPCGVLTIPYPLRTEPSCGDPFYSNFKCDLPTGLLNFFVGEGESYRVTNIDPDKRIFSIQINDSGDCTTSNLGSRLHGPFSLIQQCDEVEQTTLKINWSPPGEPPCNSSIDCIGWSHSTCKYSIKGNGSRCLCNKKYQWDNINLRCTQGTPSKTSSEVLIVAATFSILIFFASIVTFAYIWRKKVTSKQEDGQDQRKRDRLYDREKYIKDFMDSERLEENDSEAIEVPYLDFSTIISATDNFSDANKLGRGGYGPVYKGKFQGGQDIAVKRLSSVSSQGMKEFKNEVVSISKLQHRNLVRLRGYCITAEEKILLYEYMKNKSLDTFLFDRTQTVILDWPMRFDIILGVARGMLYLHQDSRLRVIHRDLKTSNILLDEDMQPKISDFGLAKIFEGKDIEANT